jgi:cold shock CspA family protein
MEFKCGTLTTCFPDRNYFFIHDDEDSSTDIFTHISGFTGKLALPKGTRVYFRLVPNSRKPNTFMAIDVHPIPTPVVPEVRQ